MMIVKITLKYGVGAKAEQLKQNEDMFASTFLVLFVSHRKHPVYGYGSNRALTTAASLIYRHHELQDSAFQKDSRDLCSEITKCTGHS